MANENQPGSVTPENVLDPQLEICDPHHHLWSYAQSPYLAEQLLADLAGGHRVTSTVHVECRHAWRLDGPEALRPLGETEFVVAATKEVEAQTKIAAGIVAFADLSLGSAVEPVLEAHREISQRVCGIRYMTAWDASDKIRNAHTKPQPQQLAEKSFRAGLSCVEKQNLVFDAWLYHPQIPELTELARAFPDLPIVLNHVGGPLGIGPYTNRRKEIFAIWKQHMLELSRCDNVAVKLGGMTMSLAGFGWHKRETPPGSVEIAEALGPYFHTCIDLFSPQRCMFESNFPVDKVSCSYTTLWNAFKRIAKEFREDERRKLFQDTAVRTYQLKPELKT